ncbi:MAG: hypothetical protein JEZ08_25600 [Clostridiales bacterium]|nr:hypothetical protein [Clostridiales bacterium]
MMKYILYFLAICGFYSCGDDPTQTYTLTNETDYSVDIHGFSHRGVEGNEFIVSAEIIKLKSLESISFERNSGEMFDNRTWFSEDAIDSVRIFFNNEKLLVIECDLGSTNSCHSIFQSKNTASITLEDYDRAELID